jgi:hypothetical protein
MRENISSYIFVLKKQLLWYFNFTIYSRYIESRWWMVLNGYNWTQSGPSTIEWSTTEDTTEYTVANHISVVDLQKRIMLVNMSILVAIHHG